MMRNKKLFKTGLTALAISMAAAYAPSGSAAIVVYEQNFEAVNAADPAALGPFGENFKVFADVWGVAGASDAVVGSDLFLYSYGPFAAPNGGAGFSAVAGGEGGVSQGTQYLNIYSDYNNADQAIGGGSCGATQSCTINTSVFREGTIDASQVNGDTWYLTFDVKSPFAGGIFDAAFTPQAGNEMRQPTSASAFIKTLDPNAGYATTNDIRFDSTNVSNVDWNTYQISLNLSDAALAGQILQFGFNTVTTQYDDSGVFYDNICFNTTGECNIGAVPVPAAVWLFGSGILGLVGVARRRKG